MKKRIATKNFLCEKCNCLINKNEEYWDWWTKRSDDTYFHKRFHLGCVEIKESCKNTTLSNSDNKKKSNIFERLQLALNKEGCLIASNDGIKCYVCGIHYDEDGNKSILCETWEDKTPYYETVENFKKYVDFEGNYF